MTEEDHQPLHLRYLYQHEAMPIAQKYATGGVSTDSGIRLARRTKE